MSTTTTQLSRVLRVSTLVLVLAGAGTAVAKWGGSDPLPEIPADTLADPVLLLEAYPFTLDQPFTHWYRSERPEVDSGWLLVLEVRDVDLIHPRQLAMPVLQVGGETAEPLNLGHLSGKVVALVPQEAGSTLDLAAAPIFYGEPELAERLTLEDLQARLAEAMRRGVSAPSEETVADAMRGSLDFRDDHQLRVHAADLIERWSPQETDLVTGLRVPLVGE